MIIPMVLHSMHPDGQAIALDQIASVLYSMRRPMEAKPLGCATLIWDPWNYITLYVYIHHRSACLGLSLSLNAYKEINT